MKYAMIYTMKDGEIRKRYYSTAEEMKEASDIPLKRIDVVKVIFKNEKTGTEVIVKEK